MSETTSTPKYKILYNRLTGGVPFAASTAVAVSKSRSKCSPRKGVIENSFISHAGSPFRSSPQEIA